MDKSTWLNNAQRDEGRSVVVQAVAGTLSRLCYTK
jgi:hypothetical protein